LGKGRHDFRGLLARRRQNQRWRWRWRGGVGAGQRRHPAAPGTHVFRRALVAQPLRHRHGLQPAPQRVAGRGVRPERNRRPATNRPRRRGAGLEHKVQENLARVSFYRFFETLVPGKLYLYGF